MWVNWRRMRGLDILWIWRIRLHVGIRVVPSQFFFVLLRTALLWRDKEIEWNWIGSTRYLRGRQATCLYILHEGQVVLDVATKLLGPVHRCFDVQTWSYFLQGALDFISQCFYFFCNFSMRHLTKTLLRPEEWLEGLHIFALDEEIIYLEVQFVRFF